MSQTREERLAYQRGYHTGSKRAWPEHRPPTPPDEIVAALIRAGSALRDQADRTISTFDEGDVIVHELGPAIDAYDEAMAELGRWVKAGARERGE